MRAAYLCQMQYNYANYLIDCRRQWWTRDTTVNSLVVDSKPTLGVRRSK